MKRDSRLYRIWYGMVARCDNPNNHAYNQYGDRGIKVSDRWHDYKLFTEDMYESYQEHVKEFGENQTTLDRIDVNGDYCLENCRWATRKEQSNNRRNNVYLDSDETLTEFCEKNKLDYDLVYSRLQRGWTLEDAISKAKVIGKKPISLTGETLKELSKRTGIKARTIYDRYCKGWSWDRILNTPVNKTVFETGETIQEISEQTGLLPSTIKGRYDRGWSLEKIKNTPVNNNKIILPTGETLTEASIRLNIPRKTLESRLKRGWSLEDIINIPVQTQYRKKC